MHNPFGIFPRVLLYSARLAKSISYVLYSRIDESFYRYIFFAWLVFMMTYTFLSFRYACHLPKLVITKSTKFLQLTWKGNYLGVFILWRWKKTMAVKNINIHYPDNTLRHANSNIRHTSSFPVNYTNINRPRY